VLVPVALLRSKRHAAAEGSRAVGMAGSDGSTGHATELSKAAMGWEKGLPARIYT